MPHRRKPFIALFLLLLTLPACGVVFSSAFDGTEIFREFALDSDSIVDGEFIAGRPIEVTLRVSPVYPVPVAVSCRYEDVNITDDQRQVSFNERATSVFEVVLAENQDDRPGDTGAEVLTYEFEFDAPQPGDYFIACFTVAAPENGIGRGFTVIEGS